MIKKYVFKYPKISLLVLCLLISAFSIYSYSWYKTNDYSNYLNQGHYLKTVNNQVNLVFYKRGCIYCMTGKKAVLSSSSESNIPTYFVDVDSVSGQKLVKKYNVTFPSTIVYLRGKEVSKSQYVYDGLNGIEVSVEAIKKMSE